MTATREALLDAAERLFLEHGPDEVSLRQITAEAGANIAAVNYYFGSKDDLLVEIFQRRMRPINRSRIEALDELLKRSKRPNSKEILYAFVRPIFDVPFEERRVFARLLGRLHLDKTVLFQKAILMGEEAVGARRYIDAVIAATPHLTKSESSRRLDYLLGAITYALAGGIVRPQTEQGPGEPETEANRLVAFIDAGLQAPATTPIPSPPRARRKSR